MWSEWLACWGICFKRATARAKLGPAEVQKAWHKDPDLSCGEVSTAVWMWMIPRMILTKPSTDSIHCGFDGNISGSSVTQRP